MNTKAEPYIYFNTRVYEFTQACSIYVISSTVIAIDRMWTNVVELNMVRVVFH